MRFSEISRNLSSLGDLTTDLPTTFLHYTHDETMLRSIIKNGFTLDRFGETGKRFDVTSITQHDPAGIYAVALEWQGKPDNRPWVTFTLSGNPTALVSRHYMFHNLNRAFQASGEELRMKLLAANISVIRSVNEWVVLDLSVIRIRNWSGKR